MITIILQGGLGNQMYQYAAAKSLATRLNTEVRMDLSVFKIHQQKSWCRPYELDVFDFDALQFSATSFMKKSWLALLTGHGHNKAVELLKKSKHVYDSSSSDMNAWEQCPDGTTLFGYFASEKYFKEHRAIILKDFQFKHPLDERNNTLANQIESTNSVSVHIRRGDYLNEVNSKVFAQISPEWYFKAIEMVKEQKSATHFYFFSDDIEWCRQIFQNLDDTSFIDWNNGANSYRDMQLMSLCRHNIIPNSTFSWWGAWLNANPEKMVIAPSTYFINDIQNKTYRENMPKDWILL